LENERGRERNSLRVCMREKGKKLEELIRVRKTNSKGESEKEKV
jgi:hypothetical protein